MIFVKIPRSDLYYWRDMCDFCIRTGKSDLILPVENEPKTDYDYVVKKC